MRILVTGVTGRVGSRFLPRLLDREKDTVRILVRNQRRIDPVRRSGIEVEHGDLKDGSALRRAVDGVDVVINLSAAFRGVPDEEAYEVNHRAAVDLGETALAAGAQRYIYASTNLVYGPGRGRPATETDEPHPEHAYPMSKAAAERDLLDMHRSTELDVCILRLAFVYGEGDPHLREALRWTREWPPHKRLHLVHHADVGQALTLCLDNDQTKSRIYNVADDAPITAFEIHRLLGEPETSKTADPAFDPWVGIVDTTRVRTELGFRPHYPTVYTAESVGTL
jgi:nucleoside-diphosphate-sugar epimerase